MLQELLRNLYNCCSKNDNSLFLFVKMESLNKIILLTFLEFYASILRVNLPTNIILYKIILNK